ncbi:MAG: shikimate kinase [Firmicutes bacterium]|nr:shikimate kinase [Bacillota bacterium]
MAKETKHNIVLTGFMGSGKSTVGRKVARRLNMEFADVDDLIERHEGMKTTDIFSAKGEPYFREIESEAVKSISQREKVVIATGGGAVIRKQNRDYLRSKGVIIHLRADADTLLRNTSKDNNRPLLQHEDVKNKRSRIVEMLEQREQYYKDHDYEIDVSPLSVEQVVEKIIDIMAQRRIV